MIDNHEPHLAKKSILLDLCHPSVCVCECVCACTCTEVGWIMTEKGEEGRKRLEKW